MKRPFGIGLFSLVSSFKSPICVGIFFRWDLIQALLEQRPKERASHGVAWKRGLSTLWPVQERESERESDGEQKRAREYSALFLSCCQLFFLLSCRMSSVLGPLIFFLDSFPYMSCARAPSVFLSCACSLLRRDWGRTLGIMCTCKEM